MPAPAPWEMDWSKKKEENRAPWERSYGPPPAPEKAPTAPTTLRDIGVAGASGFVGATKSLTDVFGADNAASQALSRASSGLQEMYTPERQREMQYYQAKQQEAAKRGDIAGEVGAALEGIKAAPLQGTVQAIGSLVPNLATLLIPGAGEVRALQLSRGAINTAIGIMQGTGAVKGAIYEGVKQELMKSGVDEATAAQKASEAQSYLGKNADQILAGAVIGFGVGRYGAEELLSPGIGGATRKLAAIGTEAGTEAIQGGQEQVAQNLALQRQGFDVPTFQGVAGAATQEGVLGALGAGSVSLVSGRPSQKDVPGAKPVDENQIPLLLEGKGVFTPVGLPDGSVAMTRQDLAKYEEEQFRKKYSPQDIERERLRLGYDPFTPKVTSAGTVAMTAEDVKRAEEQDFQSKYAPVKFTPEEIEQNILRERAGLPPIEGEFLPVVPKDILEEQRREAKEAKGAKKTKSEIEQLEAEAKKIEADIASNTTGKLSGKSLRQALLGKLMPSEVKDISPEKSFGALKAKYRGTTVADMIEDGDLNDWLPQEMRPGSELFDPQESAEYIKDKVRNKDFKEAEPQIAAKLLGRELDALEERINELKAPQEGRTRLAELSPEEVQAETDRLAREAGYLGQPRGEEVLRPIEPAAEPVVDEYYPDMGMTPQAETQAAPEEVAASPVAQYTDANNYLQQLSQMYGQLQQQIQATPDEAPIKQELAVRADQIAQAAFATQRTRDAAASLLSDQQRVDVGLPPVGGAVATTQQAPGAPEQIGGPRPSTAVSAAETDIIEGQAREMREPGAPPTIGARQPGTAVSARETDIIEGQTRVIDEETIAPAVARLAAPEQQTLADHYGEEVNSPEFLEKLRKDIYSYLINGAQSVARTIREIIRKLVNIGMAATIALNPNYMTPPVKIGIPETITTFSQELATPPAEAAKYMSEGAKKAYAYIYPAIREESIRKNKAFAITDKPTARSFVFNPDGSLIVQTKTLLGEGLGDFYKGDVDKVRANRITPAGLYTLGLRDAARGITATGGNEAKTAGGYAYNKVFVLDKAGGNGSYSITLMHSVWLKEKDAAARKAALKTEGAGDARMSHGCINYDTQVFGELLDKHQNQLDGGKLFIVPDNPDDTMDFINGKAVESKDITRQRVGPTIKETTTRVPGKPTPTATKPEMVARKEEEPETRKGLYQVAKPGEKGMSKADVDKAVDGIKSTWKNAPDIEVVQSLSGLPQELQDQAKADKVNPRGVYDPDTKKVWLVADNISSDAQAAITLAHESLGHFGLRVVLGQNFKPMMNQIYEGNKSVRERADAYMEEGLDRETAVEEVLSEMAQEVYDTRVPENKNKLTALQKVMNVVRQFLARIGIPMKSISDAQILMLIANARRSVVKGGQFVDMGGGKALYSAGMSSNFKKWFGKSKAVDANGNPLRMYHSTYSDITKPTTNFGADEYRRFGMHVGSLDAATNRLDVKAAEDASQREKSGDAGANIMPVYIRAENPLRLDENRSGRWGINDIMRAIMDKAERGEIEGISQETVDDYLNDALMIEQELGLDTDQEPRAWQEEYEWQPGERSDLLKVFLKQLGYDSIVYKNEFEGGGDSYILLDANQVKSSTGNTGEYSRTNKDIRYSEGTSSNFKKWFGNSVVRNPDGSPRVMYHGTVSDFDEFLQDSHFGTSTAANQRARSWSAQNGERPMQVMPVYLSIKNPLRVLDNEASDEASLLTAIKRGKYPELNLDIANKEGAHAAAKAAGYDGLVYQNKVEDKGKLSYVVFDPTQVKSVFNKGEFSPTNKKVLYSKQISQAPDWVPQNIWDLHEKSRRADAEASGDIDLRENKQGKVPSPGDLKRNQTMSFRRLNKAVEDYVGNDWQKVNDLMVRMNEESGRREKAAEASSKPLYSARERIERVAKRVSSKRPEMQRDAFEGVDKDFVNRLNNVFFPENKTIVDRIDGMRDNFWKKLAQGVADQYRTIKDYTQEGYMLARMSKTIDGALEGLLFNGHVALTDGALDIKQGTKGLMQAMEPVGKEVDRYQIWVALNRDAQLVRQGKIPSVDPKLVERVGELSKGMINGKSRLEIYNQVRKDMNALNKSVLDIARKQGLIDEEAYQIFAADINFIPFYRAMEDGDIQGAATASGLGRQEFSKQLKGGEKPFADLMENTLRNWSHILSASMKNKAANVTLDAAMEMGAAYPNLKVGFEWRDGKVYSVKSGEMVGDGKLKAEYTTQKAGMVKTMINGKPAYFEVVDPLLLDSISSIGYMGPKSKFLDVAKNFKNMLQYGVTLSPMFKSSNLFRDTIASLAVSGLKRDPFGNVYNGIINSDIKSPAYISALAGGAVFNFGSAYEGDQSRMVKRLLKKGVDPDTILNTPQKIASGLKYAFDKYQEWGNKSEAANRMALYMQMRDRGMSHLEASFHARDLLDFSMQGSWPAFRLVTQVVPFLNARVQGLYKLGRDGVIPTSRVLYNSVTGKESDLTDKQKAQQFSTVTGAVVLASMALYLMFKDDDEFQKREAWDRDNFWWFKLPGMDKALRVPKPFEIGAFGTIAERMLEQIIDQGAEGKQFEESIRRMLGDTFALNPTPQVIRPLLDIYANKDSFTGAPIETAGMERLSKQERASDTTSPLAKALGGISNVMATVTGEKTELSPAQIDYSIKAYFGWLGGTITFASHYAVMPFSKGAYPDHDWTSAMSLGFIKPLPATQSRYVTEFYKNSKEISQAYADMRHYAELGEADKVNQILEEQGDKIALSKSYDKAAKDMAKVRQVISQIRSDESMSGSEKKEEIDRLKLLIDEIAKQMEDVRRDLKN